MRVKESNSNELIAKENNIFILIISLALIIIGFIVTINNFMNNFDASEAITYVGPAFIVIGAALILFAWKRKKVIFSKNKNEFLISSKTLLKSYKRKGLIEEIIEIAYTELLSMDMSSRGRGRQVHKIVEFRLKNGEIHTIFENTGSYNPLFNRTKRNAEKIADFLGLPLQTFNTRDAFRTMFNMGRAQMNQNQTSGFNPNQNQNMYQQPMQPQDKIDSRNNN